MNSWFQKRAGRIADRVAKKRTPRPTYRGRKAFLEQLEDRALMAGLASPPLDFSIEGIDYDQNAYNNNGGASVPPDPHGAVGPNHVLNVTNQSIQWFTKDGIQQANTSLNNFFSRLAPVPNTTGLFDPKAIYDTYAQRYVIVALEALDTSFGDPLNNSRVLLAVSDDSDPNGNWHYQSINTQLNINGEPQWLDYPGFALDEEAIYVTGNMFPYGAGAGAMGGSRLWIIGKGNGSGGLYDGGTSSANVYNPAGTSAATTGFTLQPAFMYNPGPTFGNGGNQVGTWLAAYNGNSSAGNEQMLVIRVDNPLNNPVFTSQTVGLGNVDDTLNTAFPNVPGPQFLPDAPQLGSATGISFGDRRAMHAVWRNNNLYVVTQVLPPSGPDTNQVTVLWTRINTSNPSQLTLADLGTIGGEDISSTVYTSYPSVAVDAAGNMAVGFAASGPAMYAGAYYAVRSPSDPAGTMRQARALAPGLDTYVRTFGGPRNRWGDYSSIALDPADGVTFWAYNEYARPRDTTATDNGRWGTRWGSFHVGDLPPPPSGTTPPAYVTGTKWNDVDRDGVQDSNETGVSGLTIYVDLNGNNQIDIGEPAAKTDWQGNYTIESKTFGTFAVREVPLSGWEQTFPGSTMGFEHTVTLVSGQTVSGINFGNSGQLFDFGDAPAPYPTTLAQNGARHGFRQGLHLGPPTVNVPAGQVVGVGADTEADGQPDTNAQGDDFNASDDEDGVTFPASGLVAGAPATLQIQVSTGALPAASLQGWIDFNGDGDWSDAGEQVIKDLVLTQGVHNISINIPSTASSGVTFARFRYGYERGIGPVGAALAGEVEDYAVQVISDEPLANDDAAQIIQNSSSNIIAVLANDFASSAGGLRIQSVGTPNRGGTAVIDNRGTASTLDDVILYTPVNGFLGTETFTYVITDNSGKTDSATVTATVVSLTTNPIAVDDSFTFPQAAPTQLNVLANDVTGNRPPITISSVTQPAAGQGTITIIGGGTLLQYSPPSTTFTGSVQFQYTISDVNTPTPRSSTATVTLHVGDTTADDDVAIRLQPVDLNGNPISVINPGQEFELVAYVQDLRTDDTVGNPTDRLGVYSAYFDLLYENSLVSLSGPIVFNGNPSVPSSGPWRQGQNAVTTTPGLVDESGAFQGTSTLFTSDEVELYRVRMRANSVGQADFASDPADVLPLRDILVFEPPGAVPYQHVTYGTASLFIGDPATVLFRAIDDTISVPNNSGNLFVGSTTLDVMANDLRGLNTPVVITSVTPVGVFQGSLARSNSNTTVTYTAPSSGFVGVQQFRYTLQDASGATSEATVTLKIGNPATLDANDTVRIRLAATDTLGNVIGSSIPVGTNFQIRAFVEDLRADDGDGNPATDNRGVYAAYLDVLYSYQFATFLGIDFNTVDYNNGKKGNGQIPGIVDEVGAFQTGTSALGEDERRLFTINLRATAAGTFRYQADPRDITPLNDVLLFSPPSAVGLDQLQLTGGQITIGGSGAGGEAEFTNPNNPFDVNGDGFVSPIDVLLVINDVNSNGSRPLDGGASGEAGSAKIYPDVNRDRHVSPIDALLIINHLNDGSSEGEGESLGDGVGDLAPGLAGGDVIGAALDALAPVAPVSSPTSSVPAVAVTTDSGYNSISDIYVLPLTEEEQDEEADSTAAIDSLLDSLSDELASDIASGWAHS